MTTKLIPLLQIAGVLQVGLLLAGATMPKAVDLRGHLAALPPFVRRLYWVYFTFIGLMLLGMGTITFLYAPAIASGEPLARALSVFLAVFWALRLMVAAFVFDVRPYLTNWFYRLGYHATSVVFIYLTVIYTWVSLQ